MDIFITLSRNEVSKNCVYLFVLYVYVYMTVRGNFKGLVLPFHHMALGFELTWSGLAASALSPLSSGMRFKYDGNVAQGLNTLECITQSLISGTDDNNLNK